tara:strand:+ start:634 stop:1491 length:858 start_codon:yes stop_codon:yes gene_type:complete
MTKPPARWRDLGVRLLSALVMIAVTIAALMGGQIVWGIYVYAIYCVMIWELMPLCDPNVAARHRRALAPLPMLFPLLALGLLVAGLSTPDETQPPGTAPGGLFYGGYIAGTIALIAPLIGGLVVLRSGRLLWLAYGAMLAGSALFLAFAYSEHGVWGLVALVTIVVISDTSGYFAGRALGGPKFWPAVSPKKTWSGTVAGWICTALFGAVVLPQFGVPVIAAAGLTFLVCLAAQLGDIAESAMKRRVDIKDSSNLIPGHGGFLDRLDALVAAASLAGLITLVTGG